MWAWVEVFEFRVSGFRVYCLGFILLGMLKPVMQGSANVRSLHAEVLIGLGCWGLALVCRVQGKLLLEALYKKQDPKVCNKHLHRISH